MNKKWMFILISLFVLSLVACGQGDSQTGSEQTNGGIEAEENNELVQTEDNTPDTDAVVEDSTTTENDPVEANDGNSAADADVSEDKDEVITEPTKTPVELVFSDDQVMDMFRVERQIEATDDELFAATLEAWIAGPTESGLVSLLPDGVSVQSVEEKEGIAYVSFSSELLDAQVGSGTEEMLLQQVAMAMQQFGFNETQILIDGEVLPELFGHIDTSEPIVANNPEDYEKIK